MASTINTTVVAPCGALTKETRRWAATDPADIAGRAPAELSRAEHGHHQHHGC